MAAVPIRGLNRRLPLLCALAIAVVLTSAVQGVAGRPAMAASRAVTGLTGDLVLWTTPYDTNFIYVGRMDGTGSPTIVNTTGATTAEPWGLGLDPAAGKVYWANNTGGKISFARLDNSGGGDLNTTGATVNGPIGVVVDHADGKIYWANSSGNKISWAYLNGAGGGDLNTTGATVNDPMGVAIDDTTGRIYWGNYAANTISYARLDNSGGGDLNITGATAAEPWGVTIDSTHRRIFWGNFGSNSIDYANLDGTGGGQLATPGTTPVSPMLGAIDPAAGRLYWSNWSTPQGIFSAKTDGSGGNLVTPVTTPEGVAMPVLFMKPVGLGAPAIAGGHATGKTLTCSPGQWGADLPGELTYRAPAGIGYRWTRTATAGTTVVGTSSTLVPTSAGTYRCAVTATNAAGATTQTSGTFRVWAHRPDGLLRRHRTGSFVGNDVYNTTGASQTVTARAGRGKAAVFDIRVENDGTKTDTFTVNGPGARTGFAVRYLAGLSGTTDITKAVTHGTYTLARLGAGKARYLRLVVKVKRTTSIGTAGRWKVTTSSTLDSTTDAVKARVNVIR